MEKYYSIKELAEKLHVGVSTIWYWCKIGKFPKGRKFGTHTTRWAESDLLNLSDYDTQALPKNSESDAS